MQRLEVSGAVRPLYRSLGVKGLKEAGRGTQNRIIVPTSVPTLSNYLTRRIDTCGQLKIFTTLYKESGHKLWAAGDFL